MRSLVRSTLIFRLLTLSGLTLSLALTQGCAQLEAHPYVGSRVYDLVDVMGLRVSGAKKARGIGVHVRATTLAQVGAVWFDGQHAGLDRRAAGVWRERRLQGALGPLAMTHIKTKYQGGNQFGCPDSEWSNREERGINRNGVYYDDGRRHFFACGVELQPGILPGFEFRLHPLELIDFVIGFTTLDIFDDDLKKKEKEIEPLPDYDDSMMGEREVLESRWGNQPLMDDPIVVDEFPVFSQEQPITLDQPETADPAPDPVYQIIDSQINVSTPPTDSAPVVPVPETTVIEESGEVTPERLPDASEMSTGDSAAEMPAINLNAEEGLLREPN